MSRGFGNKHKCNIIHVRNKTTALPAPKFPMKLTNAEQNDVHYFTPNFTRMEQYSHTSLNL